MSRPPDSEKPTHRDRAKRIVQALAQGDTESQALEKADYAKSTSAKGLSWIFAHAPRLGEAVRKELDRWTSGGACVPNAQERITLIRQRLVMNVLEGKDKAVQSAKLLGQDREVNLFEPETRIGIAVAVQPPGDWKARYFGADDPEDKA